MPTPDAPEEVEPLPASGPATSASVKGQAGIEDTSDDTFIEAIVEAVNDLVRGLPIAETARGLEDWPARIVLGANMLAARLNRRRSSPDGIASFGDMGGVYVQRNDPDVAMLLQLGAYRKPQVG